MLQVEGEPSGRIRETVTKTMEQAEPVKKNQNCEFYLQIPGYYTPAFINILVHVQHLHVEACMR